MKVQIALVSTLLALTLTACGDKQNQVYAVDAVEVAQADAIAKAPKAEPIKFDDEGKAAPIAADTATATAEASTAPATDSATSTATATAETPAAGDAAVTETGKAEAATTDKQ